MTPSVVLALAAALVVVAGLLAAAEAALSSFSRHRADLMMQTGRTGAQRLRALVEDPSPFLNTALLLRLGAEIAAIVLVAQVVFSLSRQGTTTAATEVVVPDWAQVLMTVAVMLVVSYVVIGVAPRTVGRQHADRVALAAAGPLTVVTRILGPLPRLLILIGNALTPGRGFRKGPFASEAELREFVDLAEADRVIESGERRMIHSVFELGDTMVREVMVPRTDMVFIERHKTLRQLMSLALRSGFSRIPVVGDGLDDVVGIAYLKDVTRRVFDNRKAESQEQVESVMRHTTYVPDSKPVDQLLRDMQAQRNHVAIVIDEYGGTAGMVTIEDVLEEIVGEITDEYDVEPDELQTLGQACVRVSSRFPLDELGEIFAVDLEDEDVDSVGGLLGKHLGRVPIPGAEVMVEGLRFVAEGPAGRRNRIGTVLVSREPAEDAAAETTADTQDQGSDA